MNTNDFVNFLCQFFSIEKNENKVIKHSEIIIIPSPERLNFRLLDSLFEYL